MENRIGTMAFLDRLRCRYRFQWGSELPELNDGEWDSILDSIDVS
jgi:hypothetical protein